MKTYKKLVILIVILTCTVLNTPASYGTESLSLRDRSLPLILLGTVTMKESKDSFAVIMSKDSPEPKTYKIKDEVLGYKVIDITRGSVTLLKQNRVTVLDFPLGGISQPIMVISDDKRIINKAALSKEIPDLNAALKKAVPIPHIESGEIRGFKLTRLKDRPLADLAGIKEGDVITSINGQKLNSVKGALDIYFNSRDQDRINVEIQRGKVVKNLIYYVN